LAGKCGVLVNVDFFLYVHKSRVWTNNTYLSFVSSCDADRGRFLSWVLF